jgi:hypothetical protein
LSKLEKAAEPKKAKPHSGVVGWILFKLTGRHQGRRLSNYLLDKRLQLRYVAFVTVLSALISGSLGYLIYKQEDKASSTIVNTIDDMGGDKEGWQEIQKHIGEELKGDDKSLVFKMGLAGVALVLVLSLYLVVMTHKVAGPLYKVTNYFDEMAEGQLGEVWSLRKGDMLQDFYTKFKDMHDAVRAQAQKDSELVGRFLEACESAGVSREGDLGTKLDELESYKKRRDEALS